MASRTEDGGFTPPAERIVIVATAVPFWLANAFGSTEMVTVAGVTPDAGEIETPARLVDRVKSVFPPPGSVIVSVCLATERLQKFPRKATLSCDACTRCIWLREPTGNTITPLS